MTSDSSITTAAPTFCSVGASDLHGPQRMSRKHSSGVQDTLARASLSFGSGHSKVEVRAVSARAWVGVRMNTRVYVQIQGEGQGFCQLRRLLSLGLVTSGYVRRPACELARVGGTANAAVLQQKHVGDAASHQGTSLIPAAAILPRVVKNSLGNVPCFGRLQLTADPARTDPVRYDAAMVKLCHRLFGGSSPSMEQMPLLPVAPWNQRPGYLVR